MAGEPAGGGRPALGVPPRALLLRAALVAVVVSAAMPGLAEPLSERLAPCLACHGEKGVSETSEVPSLAGMPEKFTLIQLWLFRERMRKIEIMNDVAKGMSAVALAAAMAGNAATIALSGAAAVVGHIYPV